MYVCMYVCMHVCMSIHTKRGRVKTASSWVRSSLLPAIHLASRRGVRVCMYVCMYACMHACMHACM